MNGHLHKYQTTIISNNNINNKNGPYNRSSPTLKNKSQSHGLAKYHHPQKQTWNHNNSSYSSSSLIVTLSHKKIKKKNFLIEVVNSLLKLKSCSQIKILALISIDLKCSNLLGRQLSLKPH